MHQTSEVFGWRQEKKDLLQHLLSGKPKHGVKNSGPRSEVRSLRWEKGVLVWGYGFYPVKI